MDESKYSDSFRTFRLNHSEENNFGPKRLGEAVRAVRQAVSGKLTTPDGRRRGLRLLVVGPAHGYLLEDTLSEVGNEVSFERMDCVEPNEVLARELETRMYSLASKYGFESKVHTRKFTCEEAPSFLPNDFYDLIIFSHVLYFLDDPAECLEVSLCKLANECGRVFLSSTKNEQCFKMCQEIQALAGFSSTPYVHIDIDEILRARAAKITLVSRSTDEAAILMHLALKPARLCINEQDAAIRKMSDEVPTFIAGRDLDTLLETSRAQVQDIIRKYVVYSYGFPMLPMTLEKFILARNVR